jgi:predicted RNase H-like HicB family nuclease
MKRVIFALLVSALPFAANAQSTGLFARKPIKTNKDMSAYMAGAVPEIDGKVVFTQNIAFAGKTKEQVFANLAQWASLRYMPESENGVWNDKDYYKNLENASVKVANEEDGLIVCQADEEQVFSNRTLSKDYCRMNYELSLKVDDGCVVATIKTISYVYSLSDTPERIAAEDWITDSEAISKKGKLLRVSGKFRTKTIDLKDQLFLEIAEVVSR